MNWEILEVKRFKTTGVIKDSPKIGVKRTKKYYDPIIKLEKDLVITNNILKTNKVVIVIEGQYYFYPVLSDFMSIISSKKNRRLRLKVFETIKVGEDFETITFNIDNAKYSTKERSLLVKK